MPLRTASAVIVLVGLQHISQHTRTPSVGDTRRTEAGCVDCAGMGSCEMSESEVEDDRWSSFSLESLCGNIDESRGELGSEHGDVADEEDDAGDRVRQHRVGIRERCELVRTMAAQRV